MAFVEMSAKTVDEAVAKALKELNITADEAVVEVLEEGKKGFLGMFSKDAKVRVSTKEKAVEEVAVEVEETVIEKAEVVVEEIVEEVKEDNVVPQVKFDVTSLSTEQLTTEYIQNLLDRIANLEQSGTALNRTELLQLNAELDAILSVLRQ
jgi:spoIIIJ-associated protein